MSFALEGMLKLNARDWVSEARKAAKGVDDIGDSFGKLPGEAKKATKQSATEIGKLPDKAGETGKLAGGKLGAKMIGAFSAAGVAVALVGLLKKGFEQESFVNTLQAQFRLTEAEAAATGEVAGRLYADNWGESLQELQANVAHMSRQLGDVTEAELERITTKTQAVSDTWDLEFAELTRSASQMVENGIAKSYDEALDVIVAGFQDGANEAGDFLETIDEYSQHFEAMGLDGADALAIIQHGLQNGQRDADKLADAVKEMRIRVVEDTDAIDGAYDALGLNADMLRAKFSQGGTAGREAYVEVLDALKAVEDPVKRQAIAVELIGTQYEDLGPKALDSLLAVGDATVDVADRSEELVESIDATQWEQFSRTIDVAMADAAETFAGFANDTLMWLAELDGATKKNREFVDSIEAGEAAAKEFDATMLAGADSFGGARAIALAHFDELLGETEGSMHAANLVALEWDATQKEALLTERLATEAKRDSAKMNNQIATTLHDVTDATADSNDMFAKSVEEIEAAVKMNRELVDAMRDVADSSKSVERQQADMAREIEDANELMDSGEASAEDLERAQRGLTDSAISLADAEVQLAENAANAEGKQLSAAASLDIWNASAIAQAGTLRGPMRDELLAYIGRVNDIPPEKMTAIEAALDEGDVARAESILTNVSRSRSVAVEVDANTGNAHGQLDGFVRSWQGRRITFDMHGRITTSNTGGHVALAHGTPYHAGGLATVGEYGREVVELPKGSRVHDAVSSRAMLSTPIPSAAPTMVSAGGGSRTVKVDVTWQTMTGTPSEAMMREFGSMLDETVRRAEGAR